MKKVIIFCFLLLLTTGCMFQSRITDSVIIFNNEPFSKDNFNQIKTNFKQGEKIYYLFASPRKFKSPYIRVQVSSVVDKTHTLFYKPYWSSDYKLMQDEVFYYSDYVVIHSKGKYLMQIFRRDDLNHPLAFAFFVVN